MHTTAIRYGLIAAAIMSLFVFFMYFLFNPYTLMDMGEILGYGTMVIAMSMIFIGIKKYRDTQLNEYITIGQAFGMGLYVAFIGSLLYGIFEDIFYATNEFSDVYLEFYTDKIRNSGQSPKLIQQQLNEMQQQFAMWDCPFMMGLLMFLTVFIIGVIISLVSA